MTQERRHHSYSPSTLQMREACPLWAPTGESNDKATRGTMQHKYTEDRHDDGSLTDEEIMAAEECLEYVGRIEDRFYHACCILHGTCHHNDIENVIEAYLPIDDRKWTVAVFDPKTLKTDHKKEDCTTGGYVDRLLLVKPLNHIEMFDWKFGLWPVTEAKDNLQGIAYVLGAFLAYPWAQTIRLHFKQPQIEAISTHVFRRKEIDHLRLRLLTVVERAAACASEEDYSKAVMTVPACLFCGRRGKCLKLHELALNIGEKFWKVEMPENLDPIAMDRPENISSGLRVAQIVEAWASGYRRQKTLQVLEGEADVPEGYRIMKYEKREVKSTFRLYRALRKYLTPKEIRSAMKAPSLTALEKLISDKFPRGRKTAELAVIKEALKERGAVGMSQPTPYLGAIPKRKPSTQKDPTNE